MLNFNHTPGYVWPNPAFPFREYFSHPNLRIFIIENIQHNWAWLRDHSRRFQARDHFFVYSGWYFDEWFLKHDLQVFDALGLDKEKFFFMFNSAEEMDRYKAAGFNGAHINQNCWLDWDGAMKPDGSEKIYDAVYVARFTPFKRHELTNSIGNLALVMGDLHGGSEALSQLPPHTFRNDKQLGESDVAKILNQSRCGLILSAIEGACFASSEYLLCGIPVVSTKSKGGRDDWYTKLNSIIVDDSEKSVKEAVQYFVNNPIDPYLIRDEHIAKAKIYRNMFIEQLKILFESNCIELNSSDVFDQNFIHKLRNSENPDFKKIWP